MKIAMTSRQYDKKGGISRYVAELAERFAEEHEVHVYASKWEDVGNNDIIFHKTPLPKAPILIEAGVYFLEMSAITKLLGKKYDIFHTEGLESLWPGVVTAHSIHKATMHAMQNIGELRPLGFMDKYLLTVEKLNYQKYRRYKKIIADATSGKRELMEYYGVPEEDIVVIPLGVSLEEFKPLPTDDTGYLRKKYGFNENDVVLIIVATEFYRKGMIELIEAMNILYNKEKAKHIKLLVVGDAKTEGARKGDTFYRELAAKYNLQENIVFAGKKSNVEPTPLELTKHYNIADIFVFPTKYEGFGIPTVEAMACELPVIVSLTGAGEDLVDNGKNGLLLQNPNNPVEIAEKILYLAENKELRRTMGKAARETAYLCAWENIVSRTREVYEEVLG